MIIKPKRMIALVMAVAMILPVLSMTADASDQTGQRFTDVTPDKWYYEAVNTLADAGIVNGVGNGKFEPNRPMTAGELATVLWNMVYGDWCKAGELHNRFNNGCFMASYKDPDYPGPKVGNWGIPKDGLSVYRIPYSELYPTTWDGSAALAIYGDKRIDPSNANVPLKNATIQISQGRKSGTVCSPYRSCECSEDHTVYFRDMSGLAIVAMSKENITRGFAISELVNVLRETGNLESILNASGAKDIYTTGNTIPDWADITNVYHDICAASIKNANEGSYTATVYRFHDYTWAWNYIDEPGNVQISGGYANTWFSADVLLAYQAGIVSGVDGSGRCNVGANMTRAEVCQMLYNAGVGKTKLQPLVKNGTSNNILFIRDGKAYLANPVASRTACVHITSCGPYDINSDVVPDTAGSNSVTIYKPKDGIDLRQQEWPTHPEFWGN